MIYIKDRYGIEQPCRRLIEAPSYQPKTQEMFFVVYAQGYDEVRMIPLFLFFTKEEMEKKYSELFQEYMRQVEEEFEAKKM